MKLTDIHIFIALIILVTFVQYSFASHFRGGIITWKLLTADNKEAVVNLVIKLGWRRSFNKDYYCDQNDVIGGKTLIGETGLIVTPAVSTDYFSGVFCTDFSEKEDWSYGQITFPIKYSAPYSDKTYFVHYVGGEWIELLNSGEYWNLTSSINLSTQNRTRKINQSPVTSMAPLIRIPIECFREVKIPVVDEDKDFVRCRWSVDKECGDPCIIPENVELDSINCILKFNLLPLIGFYAIRLQIEDFQSANSMKPLSSIPLEFLVQAFKPLNCSTRTPTFEEPTKKDKSCVTIPSETTYEDIIVINSNDKNNQMAELQTISPSGLIKSPLYVFNRSLSMKYVNITWNPNQSQHGLNIFCFIGLTASFSSTEQRCLTLAVGFKILEVIPNSPRPVGFVFSNQTEWSLEFNQNVSRPIESKFIKFRETFTNKIVHEINTAISEQVEIFGNRVTFKTLNRFLLDKKSYYIEFDKGAFQSTIGCQIESNAIENYISWLVIVRDCKNCSQPICKSNCSNGNGICVDDNICLCLSSFTGEYCETNTCSLLKNCSNHGTCIANNKCSCNLNWTGSDCTSPICRNDCNLNGNCVEPDKCLCNNGFKGTFCEQNLSSHKNECVKFSCLGIILLILSILLIASLVIVICFVIRKKKKNSVSQKKNEECQSQVVHNKTRTRNIDNIRT